MEYFAAAAESAIEAFARSVLGRTLSLRPSKKAALASPDFVQSGAPQAAERLNERLADAVLFGAPLLYPVRAENGWLLFELRPEAIDAYAKRLPASFAHGDAYLDRRMEILLRHGDKPLCAEPAVTRAVWIASHASRRGRWTAEDERAVLTMTHGLSGMARVRAEQHAAHAAQIILYERRNDV